MMREAADDPDAAVELDPQVGASADSEPESRRSSARTVLSIAVRLVIAVGAVAIAVVALAGIFDDLDLESIRTAIARLSDAEILALGMGWLMWIGAQGLQTASLVTGMPARRGVVAYLGPSAVSSLIPGPSDLPVRYAMYQSWGVSSTEAATAIAANGVFSVGSQLALPALAGVSIVVSGVSVEGFFSIIVAATVVLALVIVVLAVVLGSESRTRSFGHRVDAPARRLMRLVRTTPPDRDLGDVLADRRRDAVDHLDGKWAPTTGATVLTIAAKCTLLIMSLRFVGIPEDDLGWSAIFAVFALVAGLTVIPITPGSAGVSEIALVGMLAPIAGSQWVNEVAAGVLIYRLLTWLLLIPVGLGVLGGWRLQQRRAAS